MNILMKLPMIIRLDFNLVIRISIRFLSKLLNFTLLNLFAIGSLFPRYRSMFDLLDISYM